MSLCDIRASLRGCDIRVSLCDSRVSLCNIRVSLCDPQSITECIAGSHSAVHSSPPCGAVFDRSDQQLELNSNAGCGDLCASGALIALWCACVPRGAGMRYCVTRDSESGWRIAARRRRVRALLEDHSSTPLGPDSESDECLSESPRSRSFPTRRTDDRAAASLRRRCRRASEPGPLAAAACQ